MRYLLEPVLRRMRYGRLEVTYWDGKIARFGNSGPLLKARLKSRSVTWRALANAHIAIGEAYMNGQLEISDLPLFFELVNRNRPQRQLRQPWLRPVNWRSRQQRNIRHHYDVGNSYYRLFLDQVMFAYSCGCYEWDSDTLEKAQLNKIDNLLRKLLLQPGQRLLDIGCGWGHLAVEAAKQYKVRVLGVTLSQEQLAYAQQLAEREGVAGMVEFRLANYQDLDPASDGVFDRIISVGMFEHVGRGNHGRYFAQVKRLLAPGGVSVLHTITQRFDRRPSSWLTRHIFPGGHLPTVSSLARLLETHGMPLKHFEDRAPHYRRTLQEWRRRHTAHRTTIVNMYDERFYRMRDFWLAGSAAGFDLYGQLGLAQLVFTNGRSEEYPLTHSHLQTA